MFKIISFLSLKFVNNIRIYLKLYQATSKDNSFKSKSLLGNIAMATVSTRNSTALNKYLYL